MSVQVEKHTLVSRFDAETNEMIAQDEFILRKKNMKAKGYNLVYMQELIETALLCKSIEQWYIVMDILTNVVKQDFKLNITYKEIAKTYNVSETIANRIIGFMKKGCIIKGNRGIYDVNPFLVIPKGAKDDIVTLKQIRWGNDDGKVYGSVSE